MSLCQIGPLPALACTEFLEKPSGYSAQPRPSACSQEVLDTQKTVFFLPASLHNMANLALTLCCTWLQEKAPRA